MSDLGLLHAKAAALRLKKADDTDQSLINRAGYGVIGLGGLGSAAHMIRSGYNNIVPSNLDLGHQLWRDNASLSGLISGGTGLNSKHVEQFAGMAKRQPSKFRQLLLGNQVASVDPAIQQQLREATFRSLPGNVNPGDIHLLTSEPGSRGDLLNRTLTGGNYEHVALGTKGNDWHGLSAPTPFKPTQSDRYSTSGMDPAHTNIHLTLRDPTGINPQSLESYAKPLESGKLPFGNKQYAGQAAREVFPEFSTSKGSLLDPMLNWLVPQKNSGPIRKTISETVRRVMPTDLWSSTIGMRRKLPRRGGVLNCEGETCATWASKGLDAMGKSVTPHSDTMTPNEFGRMAKGTNRPYRVAGMWLPEEAMASKAMWRQNLAKYGPLAIRTPLIAGASALGLWGANKALGGINNGPSTSLNEVMNNKTNTPSTPKLVLPDISTPAKVPVKDFISSTKDTVNQFSDTGSNWWQDMMNKFKG